MDLSALFSSFHVVSCTVVFLETNTSLFLSEKTTPRQPKKEAEEWKLRDLSKVLIDSLSLEVPCDRSDKTPFLSTKGSKMSQEMIALLEKCTTWGCHLAVDGDVDFSGIPLDRISRLSFGRNVRKEAFSELLREVSPRSLCSLNYSNPTIEAELFETLFRDHVKLPAIQYMTAFNNQIMNTDIRTVLQVFLKLAQESPSADWDIEVALNTSCHLYSMSAFLAKNGFGKSLQGGFVKQMGELEIRVVAVPAPDSEKGPTYAHVQKVTVKNVSRGGRFTGVLLKGTPRMSFADCYPSM
ncbi:hypothetical protein QR680_007658 [Steinernema hermaphroditum]|uniref:Uncharacterized protein n=1 Tax=Steinernema hermaphroditum TaxID=289476 RepID=A0AA39IFA5_9BILA|nr:hypothetical protein QR680_007658 [Steinernema hermaphroditum]